MKQKVVNYTQYISMCALCMYRVSISVKQGNVREQYVRCKEENDISHSKNIMDDAFNNSLGQRC